MTANVHHFGATYMFFICFAQIFTFSNSINDFYQDDPWFCFFLKADYRLHISVDWSTALFTAAAQHQPIKAHVMEVQKTGGRCEMILMQFGAKFTFLEDRSATSRPQNRTVIIVIAKC